MRKEPNSTILGHYATGYEAQRLASGPGQLERLRTEDLLARHLPPPPARVLDVGGGPGVYAASLASKGYDVTLIDIVPLHVEQAAETFARLNLANAQARTGDARNLDVDEATQDVVLLMGPLYHLPERADRLRALREAWRVLRPGGVIAAVTISRYASLLDGMSRLLVRDPDFVKILRADLATGRHENPTDIAQYFTTAFFHNPDEVTTELRDAGFADVTLACIEGPFWCMSNFDEIWSDAALRALMLDCLRTIEGEGALLGASAHVFSTARKPDA